MKTTYWKLKWNNKKIKKYSSTASHYLFIYLNVSITIILQYNFHSFLEMKKKKLKRITHLHLHSFYFHSFDHEINSNCGTLSRREEPLQMQDEVV